MHLSPLLFCQASRITLFHPFLSNPERLPSTLHVCRRPVLSGCLKSSSLASPFIHQYHFSSAALMETACWGTGTGTLEPGLPMVVGRAGGMGLLVALHQVWWEESNTRLCLKRKPWCICAERQKILRQRKIKLQHP